MKKFFVHIVVLLLAFVFVFEVSSRLFNIKSSRIEEYNVGGDRLSKPNTSGFWYGGKINVKTRYHINAQGWNSLRDYEKDLEDTNTTKIAIIGDSYIDGYHQNVENSIGRILEKKINHKAIVHEYGKRGANLMDYILLYEKFDFDKNYENVFCFLSESDFDNKPNIINKGKTIPKLGLAKKVLNESHLFCYLYYDLKLPKKVQDLLQDSPKKGKKKKDLDLNLLEKFKHNTVILYEEGQLSEDVINKIPITTLQIEHKIEPYDFGFDSHWNSSGRENCAETIANYLKK